MGQMEIGLPLEKSIFQPQRNCWRITSANEVSLLIDCADFYRAVHQSICKAQHSLFIVGWEIDSECRLLRGDEEKNSEVPSVAVDLLAWKATQNPDFKIYLLRWDSSVTFLAERDLRPEFAWTKKTPENLHFCLDSTIPLGGSHHQKIILVDDELAFTGGMDIARQRWDERAHRIEEPERTDVMGAYGPYHDAQVMLTGPAVADLAELVRWRWKRAAQYNAIPIRSVTSQAKSSRVPTWPERFEPTTAKFRCAIARTFPWTGLESEMHEVHEVRQMYLDLIDTAEQFIYIENQFMTSKEIALALNQRLKSCPELQVLFVGSDNPQGLWETEGMWPGRIDFKRILEEGVDRSRVRMVFSCLADSFGNFVCKRIHSKVFVVDDRYLIVGSANLDNRSMELDTECDFILEATTSEQAQWIVDARNDLIGEHSGRTPSEVASLFQSARSLEKLLEPAGPHTYQFKEINDSKYPKKNFQLVAKIFSDPVEPILSTQYSALRNPQRQTLILGFLAISFLVVAFFLLKEPLSQFNPQNIVVFLETIRSSPWSFLLVCLVFVIGGFLFFPVTVLSLLTAAAFGTVWGPIYAMSGGLVSASIMFWVGHLAGLKVLRRLLGEKVRKVDHAFQKTGIIGVATLRLLPIAPFSFVNLAAGISSVRFFHFLVGTFLGLLPGLIAKGIVGNFLMQAFLNPTLKSTLYLSLGIALWILLGTSSYWFANRWQKKRELL
jgi:phospholipase D1/2